MGNQKNRNEVHLTDEVLAILKGKADRESRSLKNYMEKVLTAHADKIKSRQAGNSTIKS
jgi:hypothetical protein